MSVDIHNMGVPGNFVVLEHGMLTELELGNEKLHSWHLGNQFYLFIYLFIFNVFFKFF